jgi:predicted DNA-binding protein (MmcQ/YjbR family)
MCRTTLRMMVDESYKLVLAGLPKKLQREIEAG